MAGSWLETAPRGTSKEDVRLDTGCGRAVDQRWQLPILAKLACVPEVAEL